LVSTRSLTFPVPNAAYLRAVKEGKVDFDHATTYLAQQFDKVDAAIESSSLKSRLPVRDSQFEEWKLSWLKSLYKINS
jgi:hypothetical protein